jgi:hypothetical protein
MYSSIYAILKVTYFCKNYKWFFCVVSNKRWNRVLLIHPSSRQCVSVRVESCSSDLHDAPTLNQHFCVRTFDVLKRVRFCGLWRRTVLVYIAVYTRQDIHTGSPQQEHLLVSHAELFPIYMLAYKNCLCHVYMLRNRNAESWFPISFYTRRTHICGLLRLIS